MSKHIILGAGGAIGDVLTDELIARGEKVKLVSRSGRDHEGAESVAADMTNAKQVADTIEGGSVVYLLAGLPYNISVWRQQWPVIMKNVVDACEAKGARLIFFDNVYLYGKVDGPMTETTPTNPCSKKGEVRAQIAACLMTAINSGRVKGMIARSADFYGPHADKTSVPFLLVIERLAAGKKARWMANAEVAHSFTYTGDCGKALYLLATTDSAYGQVWHLPTAHPPLTGREFIEIVAQKLGTRPDFQVLNKFMLTLGGIFDPIVKELREMLYQNEYEYIFDSTKFEQQFKVTPTLYEKGIADTIELYRSRKLIR